MKRTKRTLANILWAITLSFYLAISIMLLQHPTVKKWWAKEVIKAKVLMLLYRDAGSDWLIDKPWNEL